MLVPQTALQPFTKRNYTWLPATSSKHYQTLLVMVQSRFHRQKQLPFAPDSLSLGRRWFQLFKQSIGTMVDQRQNTMNNTTNHL
jgi:hypothetical protein